MKRRHIREIQHFTLVEMLVVISIIVVLAGMLVAAAGPLSRKLKDKKTITQMKALELAFTQYETDRGYYPQQPTAGPISQDFIASLVPSGTTVTDEDNPKVYIKYAKVGMLFEGGVLLDAHHNPFQYESPGSKQPQKYDLWSLGKEAADDSDNLNNWERLE